MNKESIWIGQKDLTEDKAFIQEAQQEMVSAELEVVAEATDKISGNRRDFLKMLGFSVGAATMAAGCDIPVKRAIPYVTKPDEIVPGVASYYASTYVKGGEYCPILVKTREGRPIKIEGNKLAQSTKGGTSARAQASVLELYDTNRYKAPMMEKDGSMGACSWEDFDQSVISALKRSSNIQIVSSTVLSPTDKKAIAQFQSKYTNAEWVVYDSVSSAAILEANDISFGQRVVPNYRFDKADVIVSFDADFLGTWISPLKFTRQYAANRKVDAANASMSRHYQVESRMSLSGSNADNRVLVKPSEQGAAIAYLCNKIVGGVSVPNLDGKAKKALDKVASSLTAARGKSLVVSASNNTHEQILINAINNALGNIGSTVDFVHASMERQGSERNLDTLLSKMQAGRVDAIIFWDANPLYDFANSAKFSAALDKIRTRISLAYNPSETTAKSNYIAPLHHALESWGDVEGKKGEICLLQPTISPLFNTRQAGASFLAWANDGVAGDYVDFVKANWKDTAFATQTNFASFGMFWDQALHDGVYNYNIEGSNPSFNASVADAARKISKPAKSEIEISIFEPVSVGNGQFSNNPWLQEMPDPVTRTSWGNYLAVPVGFDGVRTMVGFKNLKDGDLVDLTLGDKKLTVPVIQQFGQMPGTVALALGYGRANSGFCASDIGVNLNDCLKIEDGLTQYYLTNVSVSGKVGKEDHFSCVQYHHTYGVTDIDSKTGETINADEAALLEGFNYGVRQGFQGALTDRSVMYTTHLDELGASLEHLHEKRHEAQHLNDQTLYPYEEYNENKYKQGHHWGMHVDLNACTGCGACTVACMAENNIAVVGKEEVSRHHEMTWLRIDRYYYGDIHSPNAVYQPLMCQHCDNAPCENVCPVNATNHSAEGLNQMIYNRCVGTRYCANNCPFKVRRFNWLDYTTADIFPGNQVNLAGEEEIPFGADNLTRMVLNPDVTVRSRGVIEKCSFCVQRIQSGKLTAKQEGRALIDSDVTTACQAACPTEAITFGDQNNSNGELSKKFKNPLNYVALEEINVRSSVQYTMKVNNRDKSLDA